MLCFSTRLHDQCLYMVVNLPLKLIFQLSQPDTGQTNTGTQCLADRFTVTAPGFTAPPTLCGMNYEEKTDFTF